MSEDLMQLTAMIVASYVENNSLPAGDLPQLIQSTFAALKASEAPPSVEEAAAPKITPAQIRKSITPSHLISLEDNKPYKSLKRHLKGLGLTPQAYRAKWGLPADYPMVSPDYSAARSSLAKAAGLGSRRGVRAAAGTVTAPAAPAPSSEASAPEASASETPASGAPAAKVKAARKPAAPKTKAPASKAPAA